VRNQLELGNAAGQQELSELNKWSGESPQHRGSVKPTKPATLEMNSQDWSQVYAGLKCPDRLIRVPVANSRITGARRVYMDSMKRNHLKKHPIDATTATWLWIAENIS